MKIALLEDEKNTSLLQRALSKRDIPLAKRLVEAGADVNYAPDLSETMGRGGPPMGRGMNQMMMQAYGMPPIMGGVLRRWACRRIRPVLCLE